MVQLLIPATAVSQIKTVQGRYRIPKLPIIRSSVSARLGAPGAENLSSPTQQNNNFLAALVAPCVAASSGPNRVRDFTSDPANNSTFGTLSIRRVIINNTVNDVTQLRFRVIDITTFPAPAAGIADLRVRSSASSTVSDPCNPGGLLDIAGLTLETPPTQRWAVVSIQPWRPARSRSEHHWRRTRRSPSSFCSVFNRRASFGFS